MQQASAYALKGSIRGIRDRDSTAEAVVLVLSYTLRGLRAHKPSSTMTASSASIFASMMRAEPRQNSRSSMLTPRCFCTSSSAVMRPVSRSSAVYAA
eukprot:20925-Heterococcus_DN1.PRE.1